MQFRETRSKGGSDFRSVQQYSLVLCIGQDGQCSLLQEDCVCTTGKMFDFVGALIGGFSYISLIKTTFVFLHFYMSGCSDFNQLRLWSVRVVCDVIRRLGKSKRASVEISVFLCFRITIAVTSDGGRERERSGEMREEAYRKRRSLATRYVTQSHTMEFDRKGCS
jgi:hypothetical protein